MDDLIVLRNQISDIDKQIADLFSERMSVVKKIAEYKKINNIPVYDKNREAEIIDSAKRYIDNEQIASLYISLQETILEISKKFQNQIINSEDCSDDETDS